MEFLDVQRVEGPVRHARFFFASDCQHTDVTSGNLEAAFQSSIVESVSRFALDHFRFSFKRTVDTHTYVLPKSLIIHCVCGC